MDIQEFLQLSAGKWFSQRTRHHPAFKQPENGKSDLVIEMLDPQQAGVIELCQQYAVDPGLAIGGVRVSWTGRMDSDQKQQTGSTLLVPIPQPERPQQGKILRSVSQPQPGPVAGRYLIAEDDALILITEEATLYSEERLWFASPNLRLRTSILKRVDGFSMAAFCSEIRMGGVKPAA